MLKRLALYGDSVKLSIKNGAVPMIMLVIVIVVTVLACGMPAKVAIGEMEYTMYNIWSDNKNPNYIEDYRAAGDELIRLGKGGLFSKDSYLVIDTDAYNVKTVNVEGEQIEINSTAVVFEVLPRFMTQEDIDSGAKKVAVTPDIITAYGAKLGDKIIFGGVELTISRILVNMQKGLYLPYTVALENYNVIKDDNAQEGAHYYGRARIYSSNLARVLTTTDIAALKGVGINALVPNPLSSSPVWQGLILLAIMLAICMINVIMVMKYWLRLNERKYAVYKILGANTATVSTIIIGEVVIVTVIGLILGVILDAIVGGLVWKSVEMPIIKLKWVYYMVLTAFSAVAVLVTTITQAVKRARRAPVDRRNYN